MRLAKLGFNIRSSSHSIAKFYSTIVQRMEKEYKFKGNVIPTDKETKIFTILKDVLKQNEMDTVIRVAGGWVRDKVPFFLIYLVTWT